MNMHVLKRGLSFCKRFMVRKKVAGQQIDQWLRQVTFCSQNMLMKEGIVGTKQKTHPFT